MTWSVFQWSDPSNLGMGAMNDRHWPSHIPTTNLFLNDRLNKQNNLLELLLNYFETGACKEVGPSEILFDQRFASSRSAEKLSLG